MTTSTVLTKNHLEAAFSCYRASIRASSAHRSESRAGSRKQEALRIASNRYHVPMGELKRHIRAMEAEQGIVHEHTENYLLKLQYEKEVAELEQQNTGVCPDCNDARDKWKLSEWDGIDEVRVRMNPFEAEINGKYSPMLSCLGCYLVVDSDI